MEKMPGHTRLYRRGAVYYHRAAVPSDIRDTYGKREETFSLKTKDYKEALRRVRIAAVEVDQKFEQHRRMLKARGSELVQELSNQQIREIAEYYYTCLLEEDEESRDKGFDEHPKPVVVLGGTVDRRTAETLETWTSKSGRVSRRVVRLPADTDRETINRLMADSLKARPTFEESQDDLDYVLGWEKHKYARGIVDDFYLEEAKDFLGDSCLNLRLSPDSPSRKPLAKALQIAHIKAFEAMAKRNAGEIVETPELAEPVPPKTSVPLLSEVADSWFSEKLRTKAWVAKTAQEHRVWMEHFITINGDKPLDEYSKADGRAFKSLLMDLPPNWNKHKKLAGKSITKAATRAKKLELEPMSHSNVNKLLGFVSSFWKWAERQYDECPSNPMSGLAIDIRKRARDARDPFTVAELDAMFNAPLYTGCHSVRKWKDPGSLIPKDSGIFWVPLISLFSGARAGEVIQLYVDDVREEGDILFLDINADGADKRLKSQSSWRRIPIHQELMKIGLLSHVEARRKECSLRLFPDLQIGSDGYYSSPFSKHFSRFLRESGVKKGKNAFHSFRHCFEDACRNSGVSQEIMNALQGHAETGMAGRYGRGFALEVLAKAMSKVQYKGLDLSHLY